MDTKSVILIVDDEENIRNTLSTRLNMEGFQIESASNGKECLQKVGLVKPDIILLDVSMPVMDGFETITHLRQIKNLQFTPIVFLTGHRTTPESIESGYLSGGTEYWIKTMPAEELLARIRSILKISETEKQLRLLRHSFASMIVHDLRGPIGAILGLSELLKEEKELLTSEHLEIVDAINDSAASVLNIVKDFLDISEIESGRLILDKTNHDPNQFVYNSLKKYSLIQRQKNIEINFNEKPLPQIPVDVRRIQEVFDNLIDNAVRFTYPNGKISIRLKVDEESHETAIKKWFTAEIEDNGEGISEKVVPTLFDKNRITDPSTRQPGRRTGLGLVICKGYVDAHNGEISVVSTTGKGTTVTVRLPV
jgi:signal transduction histidine kinase